MVGKVKRTKVWYTVPVCARPVDTGVVLDARVHGPCWSSVYSTRLVDTGVIFDTCPRAVDAAREPPVNTGSVYRALDRECSLEGVRNSRVRRNCETSAMSERSRK